MKQYTLTPLPSLRLFLLSLCFINTSLLLTPSLLGQEPSTSAESAPPTDPKLSCEVRPLYGYRKDGSPGREILVKLPEPARTPFSVTVTTPIGSETSEITPPTEGTGEITLLLPESVGVQEACDITVSATLNGKELTIKAPVSPLRHWTVYLYNHSHVDIGYTNTHKNVEILHKTNILEGIKLGQETATLTHGGPYRWNPEVTWPLERLWNSNPEKRDDILNAIRDGQLCVDSGYVNLNTSTCSDEELFHLFDFSRKIQDLTGKPMGAFQQIDIPGMSWGLIPAMAQQGVRYIMAWPNFDRAGRAHENLDGQPKWWLGPDGTSKVLFLQPGMYGNSGSMGKGGQTGRPWFGQRDPSKVPAIIKTGSANVDFTKQCLSKENADYPYDILVLSWSLWDNCPLDADVPYAVDAWNKRYAYPKIIIAGAHEIMSSFEAKYGDQIPTVTGDFTEYWTDGLGTAAKLTAVNRQSKERLTQAETLYSLLNPHKLAPREEFDEAWRYILLCSEHTYCTENTKEPFFQDAIWKSKQAYFREAEDRSLELLEVAVASSVDKSDGALGPEQGPANGGIAVFNTHSWPHSGLITARPEESRPGDRVLDDQGNEAPSQRLSTGELVFWAQDVPALGSRHFRIVEGSPAPFTGCTATENTLENELITLKVDPQSGNITELILKSNATNYADAEGLNTFSRLLANNDEAHPDTPELITLTENGPLLVELRIESQAPGCRKLTRTLRLIKGQPHLEIANIVDKLPLTEKDGIHFGFNFALPNARTRLDIPWGIMEIEKDQWNQANRNWIALQRWADISNDTHGVTWCSLDAPLIEYGARSANIAQGWGSNGHWLSNLTPSSTLYSWVMNNHWHTNFPLVQDGPTTFRYRILPHGSYDPVVSNNFGLEHSQPLVHVPTNTDPKLTAPILVSNPKVYITILKPTDEQGSYLMRLRSLSDKEESVTFSIPQDKSPGKLLTITPVPPLTAPMDALNKDTATQAPSLPDKQAPLSPEKGITIAPYGQMTFKLTLAKEV